MKMERNSLKQKIQELLDQADIQIGGKRPWDIQVYDEDLYPRILKGGLLAVGEAYMDGWWDCDALDESVDRILRVKWDLKKVLPKQLAWDILKARLINQQRKSQAYVIGERHYDTGNDLFQIMLDPRMNYSCGYWGEAKNLEEAQEAKLNLICKKLQLKPGMTILDIGCGWGSLVKYAAEKFQVKAIGITVSREQVNLAREMCQGLDIEIHFQDYRDLKGKFDAIVSVGMFEHVGYKNYREFFHVVDRCLKDDGLFLLHTIGGNQPTKSVNPWINKYIFPNGMLPSASQITRAYEGLFKLEDWHNFGVDYDQTLMAWHYNFNHHWNQIKNRYDERFRRMWNYFLLTCAGAFRAHQNQLW
ncbi:MAG: cyclopropane fatty acyl phospholipid synthase, partial [Candidatus Atribacteria bacterium]|nr:cyclopropane fatty acyl phospholipid synthase [Candidatus Atribacteria bacterium]